MTRTDIHRKAEFVGTDYTFVGCYDTDPARDGFPNPFEVQERIRLNNLIASNPARNTGVGGVCLVCGQSNIRWVVVAQHIPTGSYLRMGQDCARDIGLDVDEMQIERMMRAREAGRSAKVVAEARERFEQDAANRNAAQFLEELRAFDHSENAQDARSYRETYPACLGETGSFLDDLTDKLRRYGYLTEKQVAAVLKIKARNAEWIARRAEEAANEIEAPEGRIQVTGKILSTRVREGFYGDEYKMLVRDDRGFKVWTTIPSALFDQIDAAWRESNHESYLDFLKGQRVSFTATLQRSDDDEAFAFGKRPTKAQWIEEGA